MKILSAGQIREIDARTMVYEGISSLELMERAANAFYEWFIGKFSDKRMSILVVSGTGNNGGDGLVVARLLAKAGYFVKVWIVEYSKNYSEDCAHNLRRAKAENIPLSYILSEEEIPGLSDYDVIIDAMFGTGLSREITDVAREIILRMNESRKTIVSIDVPSGLFADKRTTFAVEATETVTFQIPKIALYLPGNYQFTGSVSVVHIGLSKKAISEAEADLFFLEKGDVRKRLKPLSKFAHKGTQGHALIIGGSQGKAGSVYLASKAALKTGCGLVTAYVPKCATTVIQTNFPEAMVMEDNHHEHISGISFDLPFNAVGIGIGLGQHEDTQQALHRFLMENKLPLVIDADGLNILSLHPDWIKLLPSGTVLTPHPKELSRLIGEWRDDYDKIEKVRAFAREYELVVVVKGAYSLIVDRESVHVNSSGTPALATAGSGDVLTGMIAGFLAQGYSSTDAACCAVFLHGTTADITQKSIHPRSFTASDILENIGMAYFETEK